MKYADMCDKIREHIDDIQKFEDEFITTAKGVPIDEAQRFVKLMGRTMEELDVQMDNLDTKGKYYAIYYQQYMVRYSTLKALQILVKNGIDTAKKNAGLE